MYSQVGLVRGLKRKNKGLVSGELSTVVGATVTVTPTGGVKVKRVKDPLWPEDGDQEEEVTNEVAEFNVEEGEEEDGEKEREEEEEVEEKKEEREEEREERVERRREGDGEVAMIGDGVIDERDGEGVLRVEREGR